MHRAVLAALLLLAAAFRPAPASAQTEAGPPPDRVFLGAEEIRSAGAANLHDLIRSRRPLWLRLGGPRRVLSPAVYVDSTRVGEIPVLGTIRADRVLWVRRFDAYEAGRHFGSSHPAGAIVVSTRLPVAAFGEVAPPPRTPSVRRGVRVAATYAVPTGNRGAFPYMQTAPGARVEYAEPLHGNVALTVSAGLNRMATRASAPISALGRGYLFEEGNVDIRGGDARILDASVGARMGWGRGLLFPYLAVSGGVYSVRYAEQTLSSPTAASITVPRHDGTGPGASVVFGLDLRLNRYALLYAEGGLTAIHAGVARFRADPAEPGQEMGSFAPVRLGGSLLLGGSR